jgi:hypothetical protein
MNLQPDAPATAQVLLPSTTSKVPSALWEMLIGSLFPRLPRPRATWLLANGSAGLVLVLLLLDPTRDLRPVFALLAVAVAFWLAVGFWPWRKQWLRS